MISINTTVKTVLVAFVLVSLTKLTAAGEPLKVVLAGFGRTGTHSLQAALNRLGYNSCHGEDISVNSLGSHQALADAIIDQDVKRLLQGTSDLGYNATLELHGPMWREIRALEPDAKYIFIIRENFEDWFEGMVMAYNSMAPMFRYPSLIIPLYEQMRKMYASYIAMELSISREQALEFVQNGSSKEHYRVRRKAYDRYVSDVREIIETNDPNALLLDLKKGYPQLCEFLNVDEKDCPSEEPFPRLFVRGEMKKLVILTKSIEFFLYALPVFLVLCLTTFLRRMMKGTSGPKGGKAE